MSHHLLPPPAHAAPYAPPPPPQYGQPYQPYPPQPGYQQAPPPPPNQQNGFGNHPPPNHNRQHTGHDRGKSKMVVTRYARPPNRQQPSYPPPPPGPYAQAPPPPPAAPYGQQPPPSWNHQHPPPVHGPPPPVQYPPPPNYAQQPPPPLHHQHSAPPPPPQQPPYQGYCQQPPMAYPPPPQQAYPPPPAHPSAYSTPTQPNGYAAPPPPIAPAVTWSAPAPVYPPQASYSPTPAIVSYQAPAAPITPAPVTSVPPPHPTPAPVLAPEVIKDRNDPTFYDGWDDGEFEYGGALWIPQKGEVSNDELSLGQYIWHPPKQILGAVGTKIDEPVEEASIAQKYDPAHFVVASKYYKDEDADGFEYVYNFQRIRYTDEWKERKNDPLYKVFTQADLHEDVVAIDQVYNQVITRPKAEPVDTAAELETNLTGYLNGTKGGSGKNLEAENLLASLGVTGSAKPVFATPFPAYNPPPGGSSPSARKPTPNPKQGASTPAPPQRGGFNPFKVSNTTARQPTAHTNGLSGHAPPSALTTPQPHLARPAQNTPQRSPVGQASDFYQSSPQQPALRHPPPPPPPMHSTGHVGSYPMRSPSVDLGTHRNRLSPAVDNRSPTNSPFTDPWRTSNGRREPTPGGPATPAGSDFGDLTANANGYAPGSAHGTPRENRPPQDRKRKMNEPDTAQRKRSKAKPGVESAYQRRW